MFDGFNFSHLQMRYIKQGMDLLATYRPDGRTPAQVQTDITDGIAMRDDFQVKLSQRNLANGELEEAIAAGHTLCVQVYPIMQSRFRKDHGSSKAIDRLPVDDRTPAETRDRMKAISALWASLPNPPDSLTPFKAWDTLGRTEFDATPHPHPHQRGPPPRHRAALRAGAGKNPQDQGRLGRLHHRRPRAGARPVPRRHP